MTIRQTLMTTHEEYEALQDQPVSPADAPTIGEVVQRRLGRRDILRGALATTALAAMASPLTMLGSRPALAQGAAAAKPSFGFTEVPHGVDRTHHVAPGYNADILIRWGDPIFADAPDFDPYAQTVDSQRKQFGYNCDFVGFLPLPQGSQGSDHGLLWVNHEYTIRDVMFPGFVPEGQDRVLPEQMVARYTKEIAEIEAAAHGGSVVEIKRGADGKWEYLKDSKYNRRIDALDTKMTLTGPAAGHARMKTKADPDGRTVIGMVNNCAGGVTPWGTFLTCEENFDGYFMGSVDSSHPEQANYDRYGVPSSWYLWGMYDPRWNVNEEPNEANRFGWVVEIDPYDPTSTPRKHTALGRFKHEGAGVITNKDGRVVVYMGDDQRFEYVYRYVSKGKVGNDRKANMELLTDGTLYAARYDDNGTVTWLPLIQGQGPLTPANGFRDQGDVMVNTRQAATLMGATRMDRPEDVEVNPTTGKIYAMLTNNEDRKPADPVRHAPVGFVDAANPRPWNVWGHIIEMTPPDGDHAADTYAWEILIQAGNPADPATNAAFNPATSENGWFACPDNCAVDGQGRLWVATDQGNKWTYASGVADGLFSMETEGPLRGTSKRFFRVPVGAELCGPCFTADDRSLFVAVQHPGVDGVESFVERGERATFESPGTRWPDFDPKIPPRPSVLVITKQDGGIVGT